MFTVTEAAAEQIVKSKLQSDAGDMDLRIAAKTNSDGSIEYGMGFDHAKEDDVKIPCKGDISILIDPVSNELLDEAVMDFVEMDAGQFHFIFLNPLDPNYIPPKKSKQ